MTEVRSYHGQPVLKAPVWTWEIPCYFYVGGLAGVSTGLAYVAELRGQQTLAKRAWATALGGLGVSPVFLILDLGRPMRFLNMMRMVKPTSPMSIGSWILLGTGNATVVATAHSLFGLFPRLSRPARPAAALLGLSLSTYTAALLANTAVPLWHAARRELPFVFAAGAAMSAGGAAVLATPPDHASIARRLAFGAAVAELAVGQLMEKRLGELGEPYRKGVPQRLALLSRVSTAAGAALLWRRGAASHGWAAIAGALLNAGALATRWSVFKAGFASVADPKYVVGPQRAAIERGERHGAARWQARVATPDARAGSPATAAASGTVPGGDASA